MTTKLEIIGPYTPDHPGPFCTRDGNSVRLITKTDGTEEYPVVGIIHGDTSPDSWSKYGVFNIEKHKEGALDLMNAREVRVPREVWLPQFENGTLFGVPMNTKEKAEVIREANGCARLIHFREVIDAAREVG